MAVFRVSGREYEVPESFTLGELCDMEQHFGFKVADGGEMGVRGIAAMLYIAIRRVDPTVTVEDIRGMDMEVLTELGEEVAADIPPDGTTSAGNGTFGEDSGWPMANPASGQSPTGIPG